MQASNNQNIPANHLLALGVGAGFIGQNNTTQQQNSQNQQNLPQQSQNNNHSPNILNLNQKIGGSSPFLASLQLAANNQNQGNS